MNTIFFSVKCLVPGALVIGGSLLFVAQTPGAARSTHLPPEVQSIVERHQETLDCVRSIEATLDVLEARSFKGKGARRLKQTMKIWWDGERFRKDILKSEFV